MPRSKAQLPDSTAQQATAIGPMLDDNEISQRLRERWNIRLTARGIAYLRSAGQGIPFYRDGKRPVSTEHDVDAWALRRLGRLRRSIADEQAQRHLVVDTVT